MVGDSCRARTFDSSDNPCSRSRNQLACNSDSTRLACRWARTSFFDLESKPSEISCAAAATLYRNDLVCGRIAETHYPYVQDRTTSSRTLIVGAPILEKARLTSTSGVIATRCVTLFSSTHSESNSCCRTTRSDESVTARGLHSGPRCAHL